MNDNNGTLPGQSGAAWLESALNECARAGYVLKMVLGPYAIMEAERPDVNGGNGQGQRYKVVMAPSMARGAEQRTDEIIADMLNEEGVGHNGAAVALYAPAMETSPRTSPRGAGRGSVAQEKAAVPSSRTRPKTAVENDTRPRLAPLEQLGRIKPAYWISLSVCVLAFAVYAFVGMWNRPLGPAELAARALSGGTAEDRVRAAAELASRKDEAGALLQLRRVAKDSSDPEVLRAAFSGLTLALDTGSTELFLAGLGNGDSSVRDAAYKGLVRVMAIPTDKQGEFKADDPEVSRAEVITRLKKQFTAEPGMMR